MSEQVTFEQFEQQLIAEHMPDDRLAQEALKLAMQLLQYSLWLAREHKKQNGPEESFILRDL